MSLVTFMLSMLGVSGISGVGRQLSSPSTHERARFLNPIFLLLNLRMCKIYMNIDLTEDKRIY